MALSRTLSKRLFRATTPDYPSPITTLVHRHVPPPSIAVANNAVASHRHRGHVASTGFFRRFLQRRAMNNHSTLPSFLTLPAGEKLREKLKSMTVAAKQLPRFDELSSPRPTPAAAEGLRLGADDAKRLLKFALMEQIKERLRNIPSSAIPYGDLVRVCGDACGDGEMGAEFAKALDDSGNVIVLGGVVFLRPDQVAKLLEKLMSESIIMPNDPRRKELDNLEIQKAQIDVKAQSMVRAELYCGLGFLVLQTLGLMRLTFWELSWDIMEPICFFATSLHFALAYGFFLSTSKEPSFEGYSQRRFRVKQRKLMKRHNFDVERYNQLCEAYYPNHGKQCNSKSTVGSPVDVFG